jgi:hypothetical protein
MAAALTFSCRRCSFVAPWNWNDPGLLSEDPRQRDLGRRCFLPLSNLADQVDQGPVRLAGLWVEARDGVPEVAAVECGVLVDLEY